MSGGDPLVAVVLCDGGHSDGAIDAGAVRDALLAALPGSPIRIVEDLCGHPHQIREIASDIGAQRIVLGVCGRIPQAEAQAWARKAGLDPFGINVVSLAFAAAAGSITTAMRLLVASVAATSSFAGSHPDHLRMRFINGVMSRRALFHLPPITYKPAAAVDTAACIGAERCGLCVTACPVGAITLAGGTAAIDKTACIGCGICVSACPTRAVTLPDASLDRHEAQLGALLAPASDGKTPGIIFACKHSAPILEGVEGGAGGRWLPLELPSLGMLTPGWILQTLVAGAPAVAVLQCGSQCPPGSADALAEQIAYCRIALGHIVDEDPSVRVRILSEVPEELSRALVGVPSRPLSGADERSSLTLSEPAATAQALQWLSGGRAGRSWSVAAPASPLGVVRIDGVACTACGACAGACPTQALTLEERDDEIALVLDPSSCLGCARCESVCPERAVTVRKETSIAVLARGTVVPKVETMQRCRRCGGPIAPGAMLRRISGLLSDQSPALVAAVTELCSDCRTLSAPVTR